LVEDGGGALQSDYRSENSCYVRSLPLRVLQRVALL
jgi:hypothetical protein